MTKLKLIVGAVALLAVGFVLGVYGSNQGGKLGGTSYDPSYLIGDVYQGASQVKVFTGGNFVGPITSTTIGASGTNISIYRCGTATWNPGSIASSGNPVALSATSTSFTLTGSVMGDTCDASLASATSTGYDISCNVTSNGTGTITVYNISGAALDPATGTAKGCYFH